MTARLDKPMRRLMQVGERDLVVTLDPAAPGLLRLREPRKHKCYAYPLEAVWNRVVERENADRRADRAAKKRQETP